jgi:hypothetical protein
VGNTAPDHHHIEHHLDHGQDLTRSLSIRMRACTRVNFKCGKCSSRSLLTSFRLTLNQKSREISLEK